MPEFQQRQLATPKRVCFRLREARLAKKITLDELSLKTKISKRYLEQIEACNFAQIPFADIYKKNFIKCYAETLGLNSSEITNQFMEEEVDPIKNAQPVPIAAPKASALQNLPIMIRYSLIAGAVVLILAYLGLQIRQIIKPPALSVFSPQDGLITTNHSLTIKGITEKETHVAINGQDIKNNDEGQFAETVDLSTGMNVITISAKRKHGKTSTLTRYVVVKEEPRQFSFKDNVEKKVEKIN